MRHERYAAHNSQTDDRAVTFPIIENPTNIFTLLMGGDAAKDVIFFTYDMPEFGIDYSAKIVFPVFPPFKIDGFIKGQVKVTADLAFGMDASGVVDFAESCDEGN